MSRLCRLRNASHGDDGQWAYSEIVGLREQVEKLTKERDIKEHCITQFELEALRMKEQLAALAEQNEKQREFLEFAWKDIPMNEYAFKILEHTMNRPNLATPVLNKYRADGMRMAADFAVVVHDDWVHVDDNHKAYAADYLVSSIRAKADELEQSK